MTYFVKDNFNSTPYPNNKNGNVRLASGPIREAGNKHLGFTLKATNQGTGHSVPTLLLSISFHLENIAQDV